MVQKRVLLIIGGGIAAYKCLDLIRRLRERTIMVRVVMTAAAEQFVTPLSVGALTNERVFTSLFDLDDEREIGHIRLARDCDCVLVAPATADLMAKMAGGHANDLATAVLLATNKPVLIAPAMNPSMWNHPATRRNTERLLADGVHLIGPGTGEMAERGEAGVGRMAEVSELVEAIIEVIGAKATGSGNENTTTRRDQIDTNALAGRHVVITAGPTHEPIDPVRYIANRSSGKQGFALASAARDLGARVTLIAGPVALQDPPGITTVRVVTADNMLKAVTAALPADIAIFAAAVADWRMAAPSDQKIKKSKSGAPATLQLVENPDILSTIAHQKKGRPALVIGFAAETQSVVRFASKKRETKSADWIVANDVSPESGVMGGDRNSVHLITAEGVESWPDMDKSDVAIALLKRAAAELTGQSAKARKKRKADKQK